MPVQGQPGRLAVRCVASPPQVARDSRLRRTGVLDAALQFFPRRLGQRLIPGAETLQHLFLQFFQVQQRIVGAVGGPDDFIELDLDRLGVAARANAPASLCRLCPARNPAIMRA